MRTPGSDRPFLVGLALLGGLYVALIVALICRAVRVSCAMRSDSIAAACRSVYEDEMDHAHHGVELMVQAAKTEADWQLAWEMVAAISQQRLRMRNQQFGFPLAEARLQEIAVGKIELPARFQALLV